MLQNLKSAYLTLSITEQILLILAVLGSISLLISTTGMWQVLGIYTILTIPKIIPLINQ